MQQIHLKHSVLILKYGHIRTLSQSSVTSDAKMDKMNFQALQTRLITENYLSYFFSFILTTVL